jgi:hypothetical protein
VSLLARFFRVAWGLVAPLLWCCCEFCVPISWRLRSCCSANLHLSAGRPAQEVCNDWTSKVGGGSANEVFVVPHQRSLYAVDASLLQFLTDEISYSGGNFESAVKVWAGQHQEARQRELIAGLDFTVLPRTIQRLSDAWYAWRATTLAAGTDGQVDWDFASAGSLESTLTEYVPRA